MVFNDLIGTLKENPGKDFWTVELNFSAAIQGRVLVPAGAWNVRVNAYGAQQATEFGYVARTDGPPAWDYSGAWGCSQAAFNAALWDRLPGSLEDAAADDWQVKKADGIAQVITAYPTQDKPCPAPRWLYIMPVVRIGSVTGVQVWFYVNHAGWKGWDLNKANAPVKTYPAGPSFIIGDIVDPIPEPQPEPEPTPNPFPPFPTPQPHVCPVTEIMFKDGVWHVMIPKWKFGDSTGGPNTIVLDGVTWRVE